MKQWRTNSLAKSYFFAFLALAPFPFCSEFDQISSMLLSSSLSLSSLCRFGLAAVLFDPFSRAYLVAQRLQCPLLPFLVESLSKHASWNTKPSQPRHLSFLFATFLEHPQQQMQSFPAMKIGWNKYQIGTSERRKFPIEFNSEFFFQDVSPVRPFLVRPFPIRPFSEEDEAPAPPGGGKRWDEARPQQ